KPLKSWFIQSSVVCQSKPNLAECAPLVQLKLSTIWKRCSLGKVRGYAAAAPTALPFRLMTSGPVEGHRLDAPGSERRSLNQPKRSSLTELLLGIDVHDAFP